MKLRHFTKAHYVRSIIDDQMIRKESERYRQIDKSLNRANRRAQIALMKKIPAFTWLTSAERANTSFACCDMSTGVKFSAAFCFEFNADDLDVYSWREYETRLRRKKSLRSWLDGFNSQAASVGDDKRDYYVVKGDIDLSCVDYEVKLIHFSEGIDFASYVRSNSYRFTGAVDMANAFEKMRAVYETRSLMSSSATSVVRDVANDECFLQVA